MQNNKKQPNLPNKGILLLWWTSIRCKADVFSPYQECLCSRTKS